jgi:copper resistance protein D
LIEVGLITARFLHLAAVMALFGFALFPLYTWPSRANRPPEVTRWLRLSMRCAASLGFLSALAWGWFAIAGMTGTITVAADQDTLLTVLRETSFGQVWVARLALVAVLLVLTTRISKENCPDWAIVGLAALLLASLALVGHTQTHDGALWGAHIAADAAHLLAAGAWLGGLLALGGLLMLARRFPTMEHDANAIAALVRFSGMGYVAVAILIGSGLINAWMLVGSPERLFTTPYGQLLLAKLCLLAGMLVLAGQNRFRLLPALQGSNESRATETSLRLLRRNVIGEQILGLTIVLIVAWLGTLAPAITAAAVSVGSQGLCCS